MPRRFINQNKEEICTKREIKSLISSTNSMQLIHHGISQNIEFKPCTEIEQIIKNQSKAEKQHIKRNFKTIQNHKSKPYKP